MILGLGSSSRQSPPLPSSHAVVGAPNVTGQAFTHVSYRAPGVNDLTNRGKGHRELRNGRDVQSRLVVSDGPNAEDKHNGGHAESQPPPPGLPLVPRPRGRRSAAWLGPVASRFADSKLLNPPNPSAVCPLARPQSIRVPVSAAKDCRVRITRRMSVRGQGQGFRGHLAHWWRM